MAFSGARLVAARRHAGLTQEDLARRVNATQTRVSDWERGATVPRPEVIPSLAAAVGLDALQLLAVDPAAPTLGDLRMAAGLSRQQVADQLSISLRRYRGLEIGATRGDPPDPVIKELARLFAVPVVWIMRAIEDART